MVLGSTAHHLRKLRTKGPLVFDSSGSTQSLESELTNTRNSSSTHQDDEDIKDNNCRARRGLVLEIFFLIHVFGHRCLLKH